MARLMMVRVNGKSVLIGGVARHLCHQPQLIDPGLLLGIRVLLVLLLFTE